MSEVLPFSSNAPALRKYIERGFRLVYYPSRTKAPTTEGWQTKAASVEEYREGQNVGVILGSEIAPGHFLVDVDFDWVPGIELSSAILPRTGFFFGHAPSKPLSHAFYASPEPVVYKKYTNIKYDKDDLTGHSAESETCFVELRGVAEDGRSFGYQTMIPPSIWAPKGDDRHPGEKVDFYGKSSINAEISLVTNLPRRVLLYAIACLLHANIPYGGFKHDMRMACAGFFLTNELTREETTAIMTSIMEQNGPHDRGDELTAIESTVRAIAGKRPIAGRAAFSSLLGRYGSRIITQITKWLGGTEFIESKGKVLANQENIRRAFEISGIQLSYDEFSNKQVVFYPGDLNGQSYHGEIKDPIRNRIRLEIERKYRFLPEKTLCYDVMDDVAFENRFHPVLDYLRRLTWDGVPRLETWVIDCAGAEDTPYVRAVSSIMLKAAVRRVTQPGCKYDEMVIFESGTQGLMKSTALRTLCVKDEWFSDNLPLNLKAQELIELTAGKWIIEVAELNKIKTTQMEQIKSMLSRQDDTARLAYRHDPGTQKRQSIFVGTTNSYTYLSDQTGNRRFWPVRVGKFNIAWLIANRDQLWAEAYVREQAGESIRLPEELYPAAEQEQINRLVDDDWRNLLDLYFENQYQRVAYDEIWDQLQVPTERRTVTATTRLAEVMQSLGFTKATTVRNRAGKVSRGWKRDFSYTNEEWTAMRNQLKPEDEHKDWDPVSGTMKPTDVQQRALHEIEERFK